jgi:hypothetical protein
MLDWHATHREEIDAFLSWGLDHDAFRQTSALMYRAFIHRCPVTTHPQA